MSAAFQNLRPLNNRTFDGRNCIIEEHLYYIDRLGNYYRTRLWLRTDGGSIPPLGTIGGALMFVVLLLTWWSHWFAFLGIPCLLVCVAGLYLTSYAKWWWSYIFHDACFQDQIELWDGAAWEPFTLTEKESNALLYEAMGTRGQDAMWWEKTVVWIALHWFGWRAFDEDRKRAATKWVGK